MSERASELRRCVEERAPAGDGLDRLTILQQQQQVLVDLLRVGGQVGGNHVGGDGGAVRVHADDHALAHLLRAGFRVRDRVRAGGRVGVGVRAEVRVGARIMSGTGVRVTGVAPLGDEPLGVLPIELGLHLGLGLGSG